MDKKFWISGIVATVLFYFLSFIVHGLILSSDYMQIMSQTPHRLLVSHVNLYLPMPIRRAARRVSSAPQDDPADR